MTDQIKLEREGAIATVTLNQPERYNAMNEGMWRELGDDDRVLLGPMVASLPFCRRHL